MVTDLTRAVIHARRVLSEQDLKDRYLDYLEDSVLRHQKARTTGPGPLTDPDAGGWFTSVAVTDGVGSNTLIFTGGDGGLYGTDGTGNLVSVENADSRISEFPFQDTAATTYYMGVSTCDVPEGISNDTETGARYYDRHRKEIGHLAEPSAVAVAGSGIQFTLGNHQLHASDTYTGLTAVVYLKDPASPSESVAIEEVTVSGSTATTVGALGQSVVSTTASDYEIVLIGPRITRSSTLQTLVGVAFIGTVVGGGSPRTFSFANQPQLVSLEDLSTQASRLLTKGWATIPSFSSTSTEIEVDEAGLAFVNGRMRSTAAQSPLTGFASSSDLWVSYDDAQAEYAVFSTWDTANAVGRVPLAWFRTDGSSNILIARSIGKSLVEFNDTDPITVATDPDTHAMFTNLESALAFALSLQKGSGLSQRGITIEIIGDVTVSAAISNVRFYDLQWVTFRGRGTRMASGGPRIIWDHDGSLFEIPTGAVMLGWTFEDIVFAYDAVATDLKAAVIENNAGKVQAAMFRRCIVDGNPLGTSLLGGLGGSLPHMLYNESTADGFVSITIEQCTVLTTNTMVLNVAGADPVTGLKVTETAYVASGSALGTTEGWIVDLATAGGQRNWRLRACEVSSREVCISSYEVDGLWVTDCSLALDANAVVISLGNATSYAVRKVWIHDNDIQQTYTAGSATANVVTILAQDQSSDPSSIFVHDNCINGDGSGTSARGVVVVCDSADLRGLMLHNNVVEDVDRAVELASNGAGRIVGASVLGNSLHAGDEAILNTGATRLLLGNNYLDGDTDISLSGHLIYGNYLVGALTPFSSSQTDIAFVGNRVDDATALTFQHTRGTISGNIIDASGFELGASSVDVATVGNHLVDTTPTDNGTNNALNGNT